jgi:hypothetical protein
MSSPALSKTGTDPNAGQSAARSARRTSDDARSAAVEMLLTTGGDERIWLDPVSRRNRYGVGAAPAQDEIWFSSSTASSCTLRGFSAAVDAHAALTQMFAGKMTLPAFYDDLRQRLLRLYGTPGSEAILVPSGTEGELAVLAVATAVLGGPITNIVVAPGETGSGVLMAAGGTNFQNSSSLGSDVHKGELLAGLEEVDIKVETVAIRDDDGRPRMPDEIDADVVSVAEAALGDGRSVVVHVLDTSKTGLGGLTRGAAERIAKAAAGRALVVVDACQLRCDSDQLRRDLDRGSAVLITGSKFAGGPPFCGALLLPQSLSEEFRGKSLDLPGLAGLSALQDWPSSLRSTIADSLEHSANLGLGLRWAAALDAIEAYEAIDPDLRDAIAERFRLEVGARITRAVGIDRLADHDRFSNCPTIVPFVVSRPGGDLANLAETTRIHHALREAGDLPAIHLGQPVALGAQIVLRICASMQHIEEVAALYAQHQNLAEAFAPLQQELDLLFAKLETVLADPQIWS